jgi:hypothetical protein
MGFSPNVAVGHGSPPAARHGRCKRRIRDNQAHPAALQHRQFIGGNPSAARTAIVLGLGVFRPDMDVVALTPHGECDGSRCRGLLVRNDAHA